MGSLHTFVNILDEEVEAMLGSCSSRIKLKCATLNYRCSTLGAVLALWWENCQEIAKDLYSSNWKEQNILSTHATLHRQTWHTLQSSLPLVL